MVHLEYGQKQQGSLSVDNKAEWAGDIDFPSILQK
jgi:hypothetical protein